MSDNKYFEMRINPLSWPEINSGEEIRIEVLMEYVCSPNEKTDIGSLVERYKKISAGSNVFMVPHEENIEEKLVSPLRQAKGNFVLGNYVATIALCGMVAEMVAILFHEITNFRINDREMTANDQKQIFGSEFEKLGQEKRVNILKAYGVIDDTTKRNFDTIKNIRRGYLHFYSHKHTNIEDDAIKAFRAAIELVNNLLGITFPEPGRPVFTPAIIRYLGKIGALKSDAHAN